MATWTKILTEEAIATSSSLGNSNVLVPSQNAVKSYVDGKTDALNDIGGVTITGTPANNEVLAYDTTANAWINQTAAEAGLNQITVDDALSASSANPVENHVVYDALALKEDTITGAASTVTSSNVTASRVLVSNGSGKIAASVITTTEIGRLDGVSSNIQTQLDGKQASLTFGIGNGSVTKMGSGVADNDFVRINGTTFEGRSASQTRGDIGAAEKNGNSGENFAANNLTVAGNLTVSGDTTTLNVSTLEVEDKLVVLGKSSGSEANADGAGIQIDTGGTLKPQLYWWDDTTGNNTDGRIGTGWKIKSTTEAESESGDSTTNYHVMGFKVGSGAPSGATKASGEGVFYWDENADELYMCTSSFTSL